jgi:hypothetical protein
MRSWVTLIVFLMVFAFGLTFGLTWWIRGRGFGELRELFGFGRRDLDP